MRPTDNGHLFLSRVSEYLLSLPFDLKILQEALTNDELPRALREQATGVLIQAFSHQEGSGPERFFDDVLLLRIMLGQIAAVDSDEAQSFCDRFDEIFSTLDHDLPLLESVLGPELWRTDATTAGTTLLVDIEPGALGSNPAELTYHAGQVFFAASEDCVASA